MKKIYLLFTLLLTMFGATTAFAQDDLIVEISSKTGTWTAAGSPAYANEWATYEKEPEIKIKNLTGENNMCFWDNTKTNLQFYNSQSYSGTSKTYRISVSSGYFIKGVSLDFYKYARPADVAGAHDVTGFVGISFNGETVFENESYDEPVHAEVTDLEEDYVDMIVSGANPAVFANTFNFVVTLGKLGAAETALAEMIKVADQYSAYHLYGGEGPGNYDAEKVAAFEGAIAAAHDADSNPDIQDLPDDELAALYQDLTQAIKDAYEAALASRNTTMTLADGYYRIKTGLNYYTTETVVDEETGEETSQTVYQDKYMTSILSGTNIVGRWQSVEDIDNDCASLWKVTNKDDGYVDLVNMATDSRFNNITATSAVVYMSLNSQNLVELDPYITYEGTTYVNIRRAPVEGEKYGNEGYWYFHQGGHSSGKGKQGNLVLWSSSGSYNPDREEPVVVGGSEWVFIPVDETLAESIIKAYEPEKDIALMKERYKMILADAQEKIEIAKDIQSVISNEALITDVAQFSSPSTEPSEGSLDALIDGNASTFWHSAWSGGNVPNGTHYLQVEITETDVTAAALTITRRQAANDHITEWGVYGSNDAEAEKDDCELLAVLSTPFGNNTETVSSSAFETKGYKYLRFYINGTTTGRGYGHVSEFQLYKATIIDSPTTQYKVMGDVAKNLNDVLEAQKSLEIDDLTKEEYETLKAAYDAFIEKFVDPTELRETLASVEGAGEGVVIGTNPGYWSDKSTSTTLSNTIAAATDYDKAGAYTQEQTDKYVADLKAQAETVITSANTIKEGKWYRIRFASEADFEAHEWDKIAGYNENNTDDPLWGKYLAVANYEALEDPEEGQKPYEIEPLDAEDASLGENIFFVADGDIANKDMSKFRFIAVGDSAYIIQNKATNLFLKATSGSSTVTLNAHPSLFNVKAVGYGFNVISAENINGTSQNYLHGQKLYNVLVTWNAYTLGSASAMYIDEAEDVAGDYAGEEFNVAALQGEIATFCFPVKVAATEEGMYDVKVDGTTITLIPMTEAAAGRPFIYVHSGELEGYNPDNERELTIFKHGYDLVAEPQTDNALKGTFETTTLDRGEAYAEGNTFIVNTISKNHLIQTERVTIGANKAYIAPDPKFAADAELTITIDLDGEDGIAETLTKVAKSGAIYTIDGRLVSKKGNVNDLSRYGKGIYILNGVKVAVK